MALEIVYEKVEGEEEPTMWLRVVKDGGAPLWVTEHEGRRIYQATLLEEERRARHRATWYYKGSTTWAQLLESSREVVNVAGILYEGRKPGHACLACEFHTEDKGKIEARKAMKHHYSRMAAEETAILARERTHPSEAWAKQADAVEDTTHKIERTQGGQFLDREEEDWANKHKGDPAKWKKDRFKGQGKGQAGTNDAEQLTWTAEAMRKVKMRHADQWWRQGREAKGEAKKGQPMRNEEDEQAWKEAPSWGSRDEEEEGEGSPSSQWRTKRWQTRNPDSKSETGTRKEGPHTWLGPDQSTQVSYGGEATQGTWDPTWNPDKGWAWTWSEESA